MGDWSKYIIKLQSAVMAIETLKAPTEAEKSTNLDLNEAIPFGILYTQLEELATAKVPGRNFVCYSDNFFRHSSSNLG